MPGWLKLLVGRRRAQIIATPSVWVPSSYEAFVPDELNDAVFNAMKAAGINPICGTYTFLEGRREEEFWFRFKASERDAAQKIFDAFEHQIPDWYRPASYRQCGQRLEEISRSYLLRCTHGHEFRPKSVGWVDYLQDVDSHERRTYQWFKASICPRRIRVGPMPMPGWW